MCFRFSAFVYEVGGRIVFVHPCTQMVESMFACVTSGLSTPGVRTMSAWYGPFDEEPCGETIAIGGSSNAIATSAVRVDMRTRVRTKLTHRKLSKQDTAQPIVLLVSTTCSQAIRRGRLPRRRSSTPLPSSASACTRRWQKEDATT